MKVLIIGGGGREHALAWKVRKSRLVDELFCVPGNAGIAEIADCPPIAATEGKALVDFCARHGIDLTIERPDGTRFDASAVYCTRDGSTSVPLRLPLDAPVGPWQIAARHLASGLAASAVVHVE